MAEEHSVARAQSFFGRYERILKIAMKVLIVLRACFGGSGAGQVSAADGPKVTDKVLFGGTIPRTVNMKSSYEELIAAAKENEALQLEAAFRSRINEAFQQVKKRLDYQLTLANTMRRNEQKHMADWIMTNLRKSISAKQEDDALNIFLYMYMNCIVVQLTMKNEIKTK